MFGFGIGEMVVVLVIVLIIFGAGRLPELGQGLGQGIRNFRKQVKAPDEIDVTPKPGADGAETAENGKPGNSQV